MLPLKPWVIFLYLYKRWKSFVKVSVQTLVLVWEQFIDYDKTYLEEGPGAKLFYWMGL